MTARILPFGPREHRNAVTALRGLPGDQVIGRDATGDITAALALACLHNGHVSAEEVLDLLTAHRTLRILQPRHTDTT